MELKDKLSSVSPWVVITIIGCALLSLVGIWRDQPATSVPLIRGTLPNFLAVPILTFDFLMIRFPQTVSYQPVIGSSQTKWFWSLWFCTLIITILWEFLQLTGNLVFDVNDLYATGFGAAVTLILFILLKNSSFKPSG